MIFHLYQFISKVTAYCVKIIQSVLSTMSTNFVSNTFTNVFNDPSTEIYNSYNMYLVPSNLLFVGIPETMEARIEATEYLVQSLMRYCIPEFNDLHQNWKLNVYSQIYLNWFNVTQINLQDYEATYKLATVLERMGCMYLAELFAVCESEGCNFIVYDNDTQCEFCLHKDD